MRTSGDGSSAGEMAPNREVASLVVVKMLGLSSRNLITGHQHPLLASACIFSTRQIMENSVCARLAENPPFKNLTAAPAAGTKSKLASSSRPICKSKPNIGTGDCNKDVCHAVQVYGSAYTTPRAPSDRPLSCCTESVLPKHAHTCNNAAVSLELSSVKNNDPALHPRPAGIGKIGSCSWR